MATTQMLEAPTQTPQTQTRATQRNSWWRIARTDVEKSADELWLRGEIPIELGASWISPKCVEAQRRRRPV